MRRQKRKAQGQAIVEYSAVIAFVCVMIGIAFNLARSSLFGGISTSYSTVNGTLDKLNQAALSMQ